MLGWLAAAALPWLINLWARRRHVETSWAAVELLLAAVQERSRRLRLSELLLLAVRTAILLLVVFAAAQPVWRQSAVAGGAKQRAHHIMVIDQSFSMATRAADSSRFERATERARQIVADAPAGDAFTLIAWSNAADNILGRPTFDPAAALAAIDSLEPLDTVAHLPAALRAVNAAIANANKAFPGLAHTRTTFISDLSRNTWSPAYPPPSQGGARGGIPDRAITSNDPSWNKLTSQSEIFLENVNEGARQNLAITNISLDPPQPILDQPIAVVVALQSFGREPIPSVDVELFLDDAPLAQQSTALPSGGEVTLRFETRLLDPGSHVFEVRLPDDVDVLAVDNRRWLSTLSTRGPRVVCVADAPGAAEDVARALNPRFREAVAGAIAVEIIATPALVSADLPTFDAVFLCNIADLSPREQRLLQRYVAEGGAVVVILGDRIQPAVYNEFLNPPPAKGGARGGMTPRLLSVIIADQPAAGDWRLDPLDYRHPVVVPFADRTRAGLLGVRVNQHFPLRVDMGNADLAPDVALALTSGEPALVIADHGEGRIAVLATDPALSTQTEPWSTLAVSPSFVPLIRELFSYLTADARTDHLNRIVGEALPPPFDAKMQAKRGIYTVPGADPLQRSARGATNSIAVNVDPAESDLAAFDRADLQTTSAASPSPFPLPPFTSSPAIPLAGSLLAAAAVLVLVELAIAWLFGRGWV